MSIYRQLAWRMRWHTTDGADRYSERPRAPNRGLFLDLPPTPPTLVELTERDRVDIADLIRCGVIAPYNPPPEAEEVMTDVETTG